MKIKIYSIKVCVILIGITLLFSSCAYKRLAKEALQYEHNGMYNFAVSSYMTSLSKKPEYVDARIGLLRSGTLYAAELEEQINSAYQTKKDDDVVKYYQQLQGLQNQLSVYQMEVTVSERTEGQYEEAKNRFLNDTYQQAQQALNEENYKVAAKYLQSIVDVDADYKNSSELLVMARCEPLYKSAISSYANGKYRTAYNNLVSISKIDASYKDIAQLKEDAVRMGMRLVAFETIKNGQKYPNFCGNLQSRTLSTVNAKKDPFLQMVELAEHQQLVDAQKRLMAENNEVNASNLVPVNTIISSQISLTQKTTPLKTKKCKGYLKKVDKEKNVTYKKVYYYEYSRSREVNVVFSYIIYETPSGKQLTSGTLSPKQTDSFHYIYYDGKNESNLVPGTWEKESGFNAEKDKRYTDIISVTKLKNLINNKHELLSAAELESKLATTLSESLSKAIIVVSPKE